MGDVFGMDMETWIPLYREIVKNLELSEKKDLKSARKLVERLEQNPYVSDRESTLGRLKELIDKRTCIIVGGGPDLEEESSDLVYRIQNGNEIEDITIITADGTTSVLYGSGIVPDIIVTDLDGGIEDQVMAVGEGSVMVLHAHGDNKKKIKRAVKRLSGMIIGSTQVDPEKVPKTVNFGGFTDGDRAVHMADSLGASKIVLLGFDTGLVGEKLDDKGERREQTEEEKEMKLRKLRWADRLLNMVSDTPLLQYSEVADDLFR